MSQVEHTPYEINSNVSHTLKTDNEGTLKFIGLAGSMYSGKSTAAYQIKIFDPNAYILPFASTLKSMLMNLGLQHVDVNGGMKDVPNDLLCGKTPRHAMQTLGTEWRDMIGRDLWVKAWDRKVAQLYDEYSITKVYGPVIADDVRFDHEARHIQSRGGIIIKIVRTNLDRDTNPHSSERGVKDELCDAIVYNNGSVDDLYYNLVKCLEKIQLIRHLEVDVDHD